jgi:cytochrome c oxidase cbb3-type subunit 2
MATRPLDYADIQAHLKTLKLIGVPYSDEMVANAKADLEAQKNPDADTAGLMKRYPKAVVSAFAGEPEKITELDAIIAYLQMLGTLVDFRNVKPEQLRQ